MFDKEIDYCFLYNLGSKSLVTKNKTKENANSESVTPTHFLYVSAFVPSLIAMIKFPTESP